MITLSELKNIVEQLLQGSDYQLQRVEIDSENNILVEIDRLGIVDVDFCAELNRKIVEALGDKDDYSLEVGSVSLTDPFISKLQYIKHVGDEVEVLANGKKVRGQLISADQDTFSIEIEVMVLHEGKKRKVKELQTLTFRYNEVTYTKYNLKF